MKLTAGILGKMVSNIPYKNVLVEAAIGVVLNGIISTMTEDDRDRIVEHLDDGNTQKAVELIEEVDAENPETDIEQEVMELCEKLDECEVPDDPRAATENVQQQAELNNWA